MHPGECTPLSAEQFFSFQSCSLRITWLITVCFPSLVFDRISCKCKTVWQFHLIIAPDKQQSIQWWNITHPHHHWNLIWSESCSKNLHPHQISKAFLTFLCTFLINRWKHRLLSSQLIAAVKNNHDPFEQKHIILFLAWRLCCQPTSEHV